MTPAGIEQAIFRFVAQHLNHWATAVPTNYERYKKLFLSTWSLKLSRWFHRRKRVENLAREMPVVKIFLHVIRCRSQWPHSLRRRSTAARLLGFWVRIPPGAWMFVFCECFVLSGRGLCDELITRPEESYRLCSVVVCDLENLMNEEPYPINVTEINIGDTSLDVFPTCH